MWLLRAMKQNQFSIYLALFGVLIVVGGALFFLHYNDSVTIKYQDCNVNYNDGTLICKELNLNIGLLCSITVGSFLILIAFCQPRFNWIVPSTLVIILGLAVLASYTYIAFVVSLGDPDNPDNSETILAAVGITLAFFSAMGGLLGLFFARKVARLDEIDKLANEVTKMTTISAELAFCTLPDFTESHQIPPKWSGVLKQICKPVFKPGSLLLKYLDKNSNGATLRFAKGLERFAEDDYAGAIDILKDVLAIKNADENILNSARYRLGILYRQEKKYKEAIDYFKEQYRRGIIKKKNVILAQARYGAALTLYAIYRNHVEYWNENIKRQKHIIKAIEYLLKKETSLTVNSGTLEECSYELIKEVVKIQPSNHSAILYLAKFYLAHNNWFNKKGQDCKNLEKLLENLLRFIETLPEGLNIKINYLMVEVVACLCLTELKKNEPENEKYKKQAKNTLQYALDMTFEYEKIEGLQATIFSDDVVRQISVKEFQEEIKKINAKYFDKSLIENY